MRYRSILGLAVTFMATSTALAAPPHIKPELLAETLHPAPGSDVALAIRMSPDAGFHGYWVNPGDGGMAMTASWSVPPRASVGPLRYPAPRRMMVAGMMNHVYDGRYALLARLHIPSDAKPGSSFPVQLDARWLACSAQACIPEARTLSLTLQVGNGAVAADSAARFAQMRAALPGAGPAAVFEQAGSILRLAVPLRTSAKLQDPWFYAETRDALLLSAPQHIFRQGDRLIIEAKAGADRPKRLSGVVVLSPTTSIALTARPGAIALPCCAASKLR